MTHRSSPRRRRRPSPRGGTHARAEVGSVVVVDGRGPRHRHPQPSATCSASRPPVPDASTAKVSEWMTSEPYTVASTVEARTAFTDASEHGYRHIPVVDGGRLVGIVLDARPHAHRDDQRPRHSRTRRQRLEGVVVAETGVGDVRGLEGFYHYRQYDAPRWRSRAPIEASGGSCSTVHCPSRWRSARRSTPRYARCAPCLNRSRACSPRSPRR